MNGCGWMAATKSENLLEFLHFDGDVGAYCTDTEDLFVATHASHNAVLLDKQFNLSLFSVH